MDKFDNKLLIKIETKDGMGELKIDGKYYCKCGQSSSSLLELIEHESKDHLNYLNILNVEALIAVLKKILRKLKLKDPEGKKLIPKQDAVKKNLSVASQEAEQKNDELKIESIPKEAEQNKDELKIETKFPEATDVIQKKPVDENPKTCEYICSLCNKAYDKKQKLTQHMVRNHMGVKTHCHICGVYYTDLAFHMKEHESDPEYICDICGFKCRGKLHYVTHKRRKHRDLPKRFFCLTCGAGYHYAHELKRHELAHEPDPEKKFMCPICQKGFSRKFSMTKHVQAHTERHECSHCGKMLKRKGDLMVHMKTQHADFRNFKEICNLCGGSFTMKRYLKRHMQYKHGVTLDK